MAITLHGTNNTTQSTAQSSTRDTGLVTSCLVDDLVIVAIAARSSSTTSEGAGASVALQASSTGTVGSWTPLSTGGWNGGAGVPVLTWWYARVSGGGSIGGTVTLPASRVNNVGILVLRGVPNTATPVNAVVANGSNGSTAGAGPITPVQAADWAIGATCWIGAQDIAPTASPVFTEDIEARHATDSDTDDRVTLHVEHYQVPDTSNVSSAPTMANSRNWRSAITVIPSAVGGGGSVGRLIGGSVINQSRLLGRLIR